MHQSPNAMQQSPQHDILPLLDYALIDYGVTEIDFQQHQSRTSIPSLRDSYACVMGFPQKLFPTLRRYPGWPKRQRSKHWDSGAGSSTPADRGRGLYALCTCQARLRHRDSPHQLEICNQSLSNINYHFGAQTLISGSFFFEGARVVGSIQNRFQLNLVQGMGHLVWASKLKTEAMTDKQARIPDPVASGKCQNLDWWNGMLRSTSSGEFLFSVTPPPLLRDTTR